MKDEIIIVEDDIEDLELIKRAFEELNFEKLTYFSDAFQLLKYLQTFSSGELPSLIVTDYNMPSINGFNVVSYIKRTDDYSAINIAVLTGNLPDGEERRLLKAGVSKVYIKPASYAEYKNIARELLGLVEQQ